MRLKLISLSILAAMTFSSCTKTDTFSPKASEIVVQAGVAQTRAGYDANNLPSAFVMDVLQNSDPKYDYRNIKMIKNGSIYSPESSDVKMLWAGSAYSSVEVKAMTIPYGMETVDADASMNLQVSIDQSQVTQLEASDVLWAKDGDISLSDGIIEISFKHLLSKLDITYVLSGLTKEDISFESVKLKGVCTGGGFSYADMQFDPSVAASKGDVNMYHDSEADKFEAVFFPYIPEAGSNPVLLVEATIFGKPCTLSCSISPKSSSGFESGKRYSMKVTVNHTSISTETITIDAEWGNGNDDLVINPDVDVEMGDDTFITA